VVQWRPEAGFITAVDHRRNLTVTNFGSNAFGHFHRLGYMAPKAGLPAVDWRKIVVGTAVVVAVGGITAAAAPVAPGARQSDVVADAPPEAVRLVAFNSCDKALNGLRQAAWPYIGPYGLGGPPVMYDVAGSGGDVIEAPRAASGAAQEQKAAAPTSPAPNGGHSTTNTHEVGVDEPDVVKTDGKRVVSVVNGQLKVVDVTTRAVTGSLELPETYVSDILIAGDRALLVANQGGIAYETPMSRGRPLPPGGPGTGAKLVLVDLTGSPRTLGTLSVAGMYVDARQVGSTARVVVRSQPHLNWVYPDYNRSPGSSVSENREIAAQSTIEDWLPRYQLDGDGTHAEGRLVNCDQVSHAPVYTGTAMLTVLSVDIAKTLGTGDPVTVAADGDTVYGTGTSLYIADDHQSRMVPLRMVPTTPGVPGVPAPPQQQRTQIHRFDISGSGPPRYAGSGEVDGTLLNQYSLSEYQGNLRVATTVGQAGPVMNGQAPSSHSMVTVLARKDNSLPAIGKVDGLGKGEKIYAVRFVGALGYVVTFRQMDPLYTIDLSQPAQPRVVGELKITGYSAYLHPLADGKVLGVGQEATDQGRRLGTQVSIFDVTNAAAPNRLAQHQIQGGSSEVEYDPHAFLYWPQRNVVVVPVTDPSPAKAQQATYALVLRLDAGAITEVGRVTHPTGMIRRSLVIGDELWTVSDAGVMVSDLGSVAQRAWIPLR
jgi:uncharacterized secreted protein with C-terminal beta-propeller domain